MSKIVATQLEDLATQKRLDVERVIEGTAKVLSRTNSVTTTTLTSSFNVSSIVDSAVGSTAVRYAAFMFDANYVSVTTAIDQGVAYATANPVNPGPQAVNVDSIKAWGTGAVDCNNQYLAVFGKLA